MATCFAGLDPEGYGAFLEPSLRIAVLTGYVEEEAQSNEV